MLLGNMKVTDEERKGIEGVVMVKGEGMGGKGKKRRDERVLVEGGSRGDRKRKNGRQRFDARGFVGGPEKTE